MTLYMIGFVGMRVIRFNVSIVERSKKFSGRTRVGSIREIYQIGCNFVIGVIGSMIEQVVGGWLRISFLRYVEELSVHGGARGI